ncbi:hypothetical protein [Polaromonas sp. CG_9.11]|uniref:hypothetical protein n=1 Tax=Polaromonas sp. CG_9.11 TaxID=2787730 RepID=UPI0018C93125|nr:hypothetical protein [Polaromonas sp. CG_9.11]MBG6078232.1 hypothetical protein [Polaromonas sp. CG_9.11]
MISKPLRAKRTGPLRRIASADFPTAGAFLEAATVMVIPDDQTQRKAFESLMPHLYILRNKGCSWAQLTSLLADAGLVYQTSTVRTYYSEMLATRQDICQRQMNEHILLMAEIRKQTKGVDLAAMSSRVSAILEKQQVQVSSKLDAVFGSVAQPVSPGVALVPLSTPPLALAASAVTPNVGNQNIEHRPAPQIELNPAPTRADNAIPVAPVIKPTAQRMADSQKEATLPVNFNLRCSDLSADAIPLKLREGMPEAFYLPGDLEHPCVPGVMLSLEQRLCSIHLTFINTEDGEITMETPEEKRFRIMWRKRFSTIISSTSHQFKEINPEFFRKAID